MDERTSRQTALRGITAGLFAVVSVYVLVTSMGLGIWTDLGPGPGFFPLCAAAIILVSLGGWLWNYFTPPKTSHSDDSILGLDPELIEAHSADGAEVDPATAEQSAEHGIVPARWRLPVVVAGLVLLVALLPLLGFQLTMLLFLFFQTRIVGGTGWIVSLIVSAAGSFGVFVLFTGFLGVTLPTAGLELLGRLGF